MRIGIFIESAPESVGPFQQSLSTVQALRDELGPEFEVLVFTPYESSRQRLLALGIVAVRFDHTGFARLLDRFTSTTIGYALIRRLRRLGFQTLGRALDAVLDSHGVHLAIFNNTESDAVLRLGDHPFIISVWDIDQRDHPDFPESFRDRTFERVVRNHAITLQRAAAVMVNSQTMANRIHQLYHVDQSRLLVAPFRPSWFAREHAAGRGQVTVEAVSNKYRLPAVYLYYPAYLTFHKNAFYMLEAIAQLQRESGLSIDLVMSGGGTDAALSVLQQQIDALGLRDRVHMLGCVPDWEVPALYQGALAMVSPSFFGPVNLPLYEAAILRCPIICADWEGCREVMGAAALYCDLMQPMTLARHVHRLLTTPAERDALLLAQTALRKHILAVNYGEILRPCLQRMAYLRKRWYVPGADAPQ